MRYKDLSLSDKLALVNIATTLWTKGVVKINPECIDPEEIIDALIPEAEYLFNKSKLLKTP
jgi:hypothetical protein